MSWLINKCLGLYGGIGGDFRSIIANLNRMNSSDLILSFADPVGLSAALFKAAGLIKSPLVYVSIGLPERFGRLKSERVFKRYCDAFSKIECFVSYGYEEFRVLQQLFEVEGSCGRVYFVPFGVDPDYFSPITEQHENESMIDLIAIGADPHRDFSLVFSLARANPLYRLMIVTSREQKNKFVDLPANIEVECDIPLERMKSLMMRSTGVVLPIKENSYSGATTTLLQAMAMEKPVIVSQVGAIRKGYYLKDGFNCLLVNPGDEAALLTKTRQLMNNPHLQNTIARNARKTICSHLTWDHYLEKMFSLTNKCQ